MPQCLSVPQGGLGIGSPTHWGGRGAYRCDLEDDKATFWFRDQFLIGLCAPVGPAVPWCGAPLCSITFIAGEEVEEILLFCLGMAIHGRCSF